MPREPLKTESSDPQGSRYLVIDINKKSEERICSGHRPVNITVKDSPSSVAAPCGGLPQNETRAFLKTS